ncbi:Cas9 inhibitor AcrIIA9 family protein [uncultured Acetatifactor sp.]|jgi:hypothetical protein|uniref:Cas9 inhibitor AcrIIA9 family protein n=1 Tax=uncultured Acetatifactor sp. TaxID=1671927 RepID=UPI002609478B|nr:Cas9 inhibitor AcrIIA9 family protein [uncultured Acetatifactor sp.]
MDNFATINIGQDREDMPLPYEGRESIQDGYLRGTDVFQDGFAVMGYSPFDDADAAEGQKGYPAEANRMGIGGEESAPIMGEKDGQDSGCGYRIGGDGSTEDDTGTSPIKMDDTDAGEEQKHAEHETSEAKRKAEWEARQQTKKEVAKTQLERIKAMSVEELVSESVKRVGADTEKLTRRNMKECVSEYIQTACMEDEEFARQVMLPQKNMVRCFQYINRKAYEYVQDEMKANGIEPGRNTSCYSADIPDGLCYHWAEEYFRTMDVKEDEEEEEKFVPKPYAGRTASGSKGKKSGAKKSAAKKPATAKAAEKKPSDKKPEIKKPAGDGRMPFMEQLSFEGMISSVSKVG